MGESVGGRKEGHFILLNTADEDQSLFGGRLHYTTISDDITMTS